MIYCRGKSINGEAHSRRAPVSILFEKNLNFFRYLSISYFKNLIYIFELLIKTMASTSLFLIFRICPCIVTKTRISVALCLLSKVKETAALLYRTGYKFPSFIILYLQQCHLNLKIVIVF